MIISKLMGGMGNQMFQYALGRSLSLRHHVPLGLDISFFSHQDPSIVQRKYDLDVFNIDARIATAHEVNRYARKEIYRFLPPAAQYIREKSYTFDAEVFQISPNAYLDGYWQSWKYFQAAEETIRNDFTLKEPLPSAVIALKEKISSCESVCINVRRADFVNHARNSAYHGSCDMEYFDSAVTYVRKKLRNPYFFIFSDDLPWCEEHLLPRYKGEIVPHSLAGKQFQFYLQLIAACEHQIIPNSSFGWWGAWLNNNPNKIIVAPKRWTNAVLDTSDLIPPGWECL